MRGVFRKNEPEAYRGSGRPFAATELMTVDQQPEMYNGEIDF
jgi:hypothetical protein